MNTISAINKAINWMLCKPIIVQKPLICPPEIIDSLPICCNECKKFKILDIDGEGTEIGDPDLMYCCCDAAIEGYKIIQSYDYGYRTPRPIVRIPSWCPRNFKTRTGKEK
jgi:hypothetical protein